GSHYLTTSNGERDALVSAGWKYELDDGFVFSTNVPGTTDVFHLYNTQTGDHFFTTSTIEVTAATTAVGSTWVKQTSLGFAFDDPNSLNQPGFAQGEQLSAYDQDGLHKNDVADILKM